jgi:sulfur transfer complex TusBCD TusB component (DsrH family)
MSNTLWCGFVTEKLYLQSGQFTSTLKTSEYVGSIDIYPFGVSSDGTNTPWAGSQADKLYLTSGQFTSTLKTSEYVGSIDTLPQGVSFDRINTPWVGNSADKLYLTSGQFTSTLKTSEYVGSIDTAPRGISFDRVNTPWAGNAADKLYLTSGQFTSTLKTSEYIGGIDTSPRGISFDRVNTPWVGNAADKLYLTSGQFTSTLKTSEYVGSIDTSPTDIDTDDIDSRLPSMEIPASVFNPVLLNQFVDHPVTFNKSFSNALLLNQSVPISITFDRHLSETILFSQRANIGVSELASSIILLNQSVIINIIPPVRGGNPTLNRFIRRTLYNLKRQYGNRIDIYKLQDTATDYQTGEKTVTKSVIVVRKCVVLPVKIAREVVQTITQISANKMFVYGGSYDAGTRMFIIDARDMPNNYEFTNDDWLIYNGRRYDIKSIEEFEQNAAWSIIGKEVKGVRPEQVFFAHITEQFVLEQTV